MTNEEHDVETMIVEKAQAIFARYGYRKTTMDDIARATYKGKSTLYHYFPSKEGLFTAVIEREVKELKAEIHQALAAENSAPAKLRIYILTRMRAFKRLANLYQAFADEYLENYRFIEQIRTSYDEYERMIISDILLEGVQTGLFTVSDLDLIAHVIVVASKGLEYQWALDNDTEKTERNIDTLLQIFFYGLFTRA
jgi:AcrR family transcriptional regulator